MLLFFISSLVGVAVSFIHLSVALCVACFLCAGVLGVYAKFSKTEDVRKVSHLLIIFFIGLCVGQLRVFMISYPDIKNLPTQESKNIALHGVVVREPVSDGEKQKVMLRVDKVSFGSTTKQVDTRVLLSTHAFPEFSYGDYVVATGTLRVPGRIEADDGRMFDYQMYLFKDSITHTLSFASIKKIGEEGKSILTILFGLKRRFVESIRNVVPEPEAGLLAGILLGTDALPKTITDQFRTAGLSHIIVLSGYNITVVAESILVVMKYVSVRFAFGASLFGVIFFVLMAGSGASAVRAGIMASIALLGKQFHKTYNVSRALLLAVWGMVMWNPFILLYDPSFHLSVLATIGVMYVAPIVLKHISFITEKYGLRELSATTLGAQFSVLPYIVYMSGNFGVFAFPANFVVLPFVPLTMLLGFCTAIAGFVSRFLGLIPGIPTYLLLSWDIFIAESVSKLPFANIHVPYIPVFWLVVCYVVFGFILYRFHKKQNLSVAEPRSGDDSVVGY